MKKFVAILLLLLISFSTVSCGASDQNGNAPYIQDGYWYVNGENTGVRAEGLNGSNGTDGNGILSIELTSSENGVDTYTVTFTNGQTTTFTVTNGSSSQDPAIPAEFELVEHGEGYVSPSIPAGKPITFGTFSTHSKYVIPPNVSVVVTMKSGGSYGFARTDKDGAVLESCSNSDRSQHTFTARADVTYLYVSDVKVERIDHWSNVQTNSYWSGKNIWWCGTSIPAGGYPLLVGKELGATVFQEAVGGSMCRANVSTGDYNGANISNITSALSMTLEEANLFIENYSYLSSLSKNSAWPNALSDSQKQRMMSGSFEKKLLPYLDGRKPMPDLFVIDHGHNDWKYYGVDGKIDIELEPTVENIKKGLLAEDTYMTANNYANLKKYFGDLSDIPQNKLEEFAASVNRNCYKGAVNFIITLILRYNPYARIVFISNYEYEDGYNKAYSNVVDAQISLSKDWCFPIFEIYKYLGYSDNIIPGSKDYLSALYPEYTFDKDVSVYEVYNIDKVHPSSDKTGRANQIYAGLIAAFLESVR